MRKNNRRQAAKKIFLSCATIPLLPDNWVKPIVRSVILPVHAQTSVDNRLVIEGFEWGCSNLANTNFESYDVNDRKSPPTLIKSLGFGMNQRTILFKRTFFDESVDGGGVEITGDILIEVAQQIIVDSSGSANCSEPATPSPIGNYRVEFLSLLRKPWQIEFSVTINGRSSYIFSDFIITPLVN